jgi:hypothetical protein
MNTPESDRMREFWRLHKDGVPITVLYLPCPRLKDRAFSWAPVSVLSCQMAGLGLYDYCNVTDQGLRLTLAPYTSFTLSTPNEVYKSIFPCILDGYKYFIKKSPVKSNPSWDGLDLHTRQGLALMIEQPTAKEEDERWSIRASGASRAALVSIVDRRGGIFAAEYLALVSLVQEGSSYHRFPNPPWSAQEIDEAGGAPCKGDWIQTDQEWCLA